MKVDKELDVTFVEWPPTGDRNGDLTGCCVLGRYWMIKEHVLFQVSSSLVASAEDKIAH
jgi:hypothetical protein